MLCLDVRFIIVPWLICPLVCEKILLFPFPWPSHHTLLEKIGIELQKRHHDVYMIIPSTESYSINSSIPKIHYAVNEEYKNIFVNLAERTLESGVGFGVDWVDTSSKILAIS